VSRDYQPRPKSSRSSNCELWNQSSSLAEYTADSIDCVNHLVASPILISKSLSPSRCGRIQAKIDTSSHGQTLSLQLRHPQNTYILARRAGSEMVFAIYYLRQRRTRSVQHPRWTFELHRLALLSLLILYSTTCRPTASFADCHSNLKPSFRAVLARESRQYINAELLIVAAVLLDRLSNSRFHCSTFHLYRVYQLTSCPRVLKNVLMACSRLRDTIRCSSKVFSLRWEQIAL
jgi:hypothetical protein